MGFWSLAPQKAIGVGESAPEAREKNGFAAPKKGVPLMNIALLGAAEKLGFVLERGSLKPIYTYTTIDGPPHGAEKATRLERQSSGILLAEY